MSVVVVASVDTSRLLSVPVISGRRYFSLEYGLVNVSTNNTTVTVYGLFGGQGSDGTIRVNWELQDGSITSGASGYKAASGTWVVEPGKVGYVGQPITINNVDLSKGAQHFIFKVTSTSITGGPNLLVNEFDHCFIKVNSGAVDPDALIVDKDHVSASDSNPGTASLPFATFQKGIDEAISQSKRCYVKEATTAYQELTRKSTSNTGGPTIQKTSGGSFTSFTKIAGYPGERPIIDNNYQADSNSNPAAPLHIMDGDYIWVENFTMRNCAAGITFHSSNATSFCVLEDIESYGHVGGGAFSDIASAGNMGAVRLDNSTKTLIHNCKLSRTYDKRSTAWLSNPTSDSNISSNPPWEANTSYSVNDVVGSSGNYYICTTSGTSASSPSQDGLSGTGTGITDNTCVWDYQSAATTVGGVIVYGYHAGVHGFADHQCVVERSELYDVNRPIYCKQQPVTVSTQTRCVRNNYIHDYTGAAADFNSQGAGNDNPQKPLVYFNKLKDGQSLATVRRSSSDELQAKDALIFSNSCYQVTGGVSIDLCEGVEHFDNIYSGVSPNFSNGKVIALQYDSDGYISRLLYSNDNTYHNFTASTRFFVEENGPGEVSYLSLSAWQASTNNAQIPDDPDADSTTTDPNYTNAGAGDLTRTGSPTDGTHGQPRGAYFDSNVAVGAD